MVNLLDEEIDIPFDFSDLVSDWKRAYIYAVDYMTIGISKKRIPYLEKHAWRKAVMPFKKSGDAIFFNLPEEFCKFYHKSSRVTIIDIQKDHITLTIRNKQLEE